MKVRIDSIECPLMYRLSYTGKHISSVYLSRNLLGNYSPVVGLLVFNKTRAMVTAAKRVKTTVGSQILLFDSCLHLKCNPERSTCDTRREIVAYLSMRRETVSRVCISYIFDIFPSKTNKSSVRSDPAQENELKCVYSLAVNISVRKACFSGAWSSCFAKHRLTKHPLDEFSEENVSFCGRKKNATLFKAVVVLARQSVEWNFRHTRRERQLDDCRPALNNEERLSGSWMVFGWQSLNKSSLWYAYSMLFVYRSERGRAKMCSHNSILPIQAS